METYLLFLFSFLENGSLQKGTFFFLFDRKKAIADLSKEEEKSLEPEREQKRT
jgi:hypothetical protein